MNNKLPSIRRLHTSYIIALILSQGLLFSQPTSSIVYPDTDGDGKLIYKGYANHDQNTEGNLMIDFSYAGYMGGGVAIPWVPVVATLEPDPNGGDDSARIQAAIDNMTTSESSPGALLLRAGNYSVSQTLRITKSGVVIRGEGQHIGGTKILFTATVQDNLFEFDGSGGWSKIEESESPITDSLIPSGTYSFNVASTDNFEVNDRVIVSRTPNSAWITHLGMDLIEAADPEDRNWTPESYVSRMPRTITAINGNTLTVDAPLIHAIETRYGGGEVYKYHFDNAVRQIGIEQIRLESTYADNRDPDHGWNAILFEQVENAWARQVTSEYFGYSCVTVDTNSQYVTVEDCAQLEPKSPTNGGNRYSFRIDDSSFVLFQRCYTKDGRHDFVTSSRTVGPNVFVDCLAEQAQTDIGPHERYSEGLLFDNIKSNNSIRVQNRFTSGSGHGWAGAQTVFWNCQASSVVCDTPPAAMNFAIGCIGAKEEGRNNEPFGFWESEGIHVTPRSLYYKQLEDRLGSSAVLSVTVPKQRDGVIWDELSEQQNNNTAAINAVVGESVVLSATADYLLPSPLSSNQSNSGWSLLSGPAAVNFENPNSANTTASFSEAGIYKLQYTRLEQENLGTSDTITYSAYDYVTVVIPTNNSILNPANFVPIGTITASTPELSFDTDSLTVSGGLTGNGVINLNEGGSEVAVFAFHAVNLASQPIISGSRPLVIVSHEDLLVSTDIDISGGNGGHQTHGEGLAGGGNGGDANRDDTPGNPLDGQGPGGSLGNPNRQENYTSGGGGFGGVGGNGTGDGGISYGSESLEPLTGGSGAGGSFKKGGGAGGGAIGLIATEALTISANGAIYARGGNGAGSDSQWTSGGGSGGAILLYGRDVSIQGAVNANGGDGGNASGGQTNGGGGGGGRIAIYYEDSLNTANANITVTGGQPIGGDSTGQPGEDGTIYYSQNDPDTLTPEEQWLADQLGITSQPSPEDWTADQDGDGLNARIEYALGGSLSTADQPLLPKLSSDHLFTFNRRQDGIDTTDYIVEISTTLQPEDWTELSQSNATVDAHPTISGFDQVTVSVPDNELKLFVRLRIR